MIKNGPVSYFSVLEYIADREPFIGEFIDKLREKKLAILEENAKLIKEKEEQFQLELSSFRDKQTAEFTLFFVVLLQTIQLRLENNLRKSDILLQFIINTRKNLSIKEFNKYTDRCACKENMSKGKEEGLVTALLERYSAEFKVLLQQHIDSLVKNTQQSPKQHSEQEPLSAPSRANPPLQPNAYDKLKALMELESLLNNDTFEAKWSGVSRQVPELLYRPPVGKNVGEVASVVSASNDATRSAVPSGLQQASSLSSSTDVNNDSSLTDLSDIDPKNLYLVEDSITIMRSLIVNAIAQTTAQSQVLNAYILDLSEQSDQLARNGLPHADATDLYVITWSMDEDKEMEDELINRMKVLMNIKIDKWQAKILKQPITETSFKDWERYFNDKNMIHPRSTPDIEEVPQAVPNSSGIGASVGKKVETKRRTVPSLIYQPPHKRKMTVPSLIYQPPHKRKMTVPSLIYQPPPKIPNSYTNACVDKSKDKFEGTISELVGEVICRVGPGRFDEMIFKLLNPPQKGRSPLRREGWTGRQDGALRSGNSAVCEDSWAGGTSCYRPLSRHGGLPNQHQKMEDFLRHAGSQLTPQKPGLPKSRQKGLKFPAAGNSRASHNRSI